MASYAFKEENRINRVDASKLAENIYDTERTSDYYCAGLACTARMRLRLQNSRQCDHFAADRNHPHAHGCAYAKINYNPNEFNEQGFIFRDAILYLLTNKQSPNGNRGVRNNGEKIRKNITSLRDIYSMLKYYAPEDIKGGNFVWRLLLDERSVSKFLAQEQLILGRIIAEARFYGSNFYSRPERQIELIVKNGNDQILLTLNIATQELFEKLLAQIFIDKKQRNYRFWNVVVAGLWEPDGEDRTHFKTKIYRRKQILFLKPPKNK